MIITWEHLLLKFVQGWQKGDEVDTVNEGSSTCDEWNLWKFTNIRVQAQHQEHTLDQSLIEESESQVRGVANRMLLGWFEGENAFPPVEHEDERWKAKLDDDRFVGDEWDGETEEGDRVAKEVSRHVEDMVHIPRGLGDLDNSMKKCESVDRIIEEGQAVRFSCLRDGWNSSAGGG